MKDESKRFWSEKFLIQKNYQSKKCGQNKIMLKTNFCPKKMFGPRKMFGPKKLSKNNFGQKDVCPKKCGSNR